VGSYTKLLYHVVFATKYRRGTIRDEFRRELYEYIGGVIRHRSGALLEIGGVEDHVHLLANLPASKAVSDVIRDIKSNSSKWLNERDDIPQIFEWQKGFGAFTVSYDRREIVTKYIRNQVEHHRTQTFQEEYVAFLERHDIKFERRYLFEGEFHG
jgi:REP element-mobilizing transposase RayT